MCLLYSAFHFVFGSGFVCSVLKPDYLKRGGLCAALLDYLNPADRPFLRVCCSSNCHGCCVLPSLCVWRAISFVPTTRTTAYILTPVHGVLSHFHLNWLQHSCCFTDAQTRFGFLLCRCCWCVRTLCPFVMTPFASTGGSHCHVSYPCIPNHFGFLKKNLNNHLFDSEVQSVYTYPNGQSASGLGVVSILVVASYCLYASLDKQCVWSFGPSLGLSMEHVIHPRIGVLPITTLW